MYAIKIYIFISIFILLSSPVRGQEHNEATGTINIKNGKTYTYKLSFNVSGKDISGYATTILDDGSQTKATISGEIDRNQKTLTIVESPYSEPQKNPIFCFINATLHYVLQGQLYTISGSFKGVDDNGMYCAEGTVGLKMAAQKSGIFTQSTSPGTEAVGAGHGNKRDNHAQSQNIKVSRPGLPVTGTSEEFPDKTHGVRQSDKSTKQTNRTRNQFTEREKTDDKTLGRDRPTKSRKVVPGKDATVSKEPGSREEDPGYLGKIAKNNPNRNSKTGSSQTKGVTKPAETVNNTVEDADTTSDMEEYTITAGLKQVFYWMTDTCVMDLYDGGVVDGDIVTVYLNGEEILTKYTLAKKKKQMKLYLNKDISSIEIVAENLGKTPPNTSNIILMDGKRIYRLRAYNDIGESAEIILKKKKNQGKQQPQ